MLSNLLFMHRSYLTTESSSTETCVGDASTFGNASLKVLVILPLFVLASYSCEDGCDELFAGEPAAAGSSALNLCALWISVAISLRFRSSSAASSSRFLRASCTSLSVRIHTNE